MQKKNRRAVSTSCFIETLENRQFLSASPTAPAAVRPAAAASIATRTGLTLKSSAAPLLGQTITLSVQVTSRSGTPSGAVKFYDGGAFLGAATLNHAHGNCTASFNTIVDNTLFNGTHPFTARYGGKAQYKSSASRTAPVTISQPSAAPAGDGLTISTVVRGSGTATAQAAARVTVEFTQYLTDGQVVDSSAIDRQASQLNLVLGSGGVIQGLEEGVPGMKVGETRILDLPADLAYGVNPPAALPGRVQIPPSAELIYVLTLLSIP